MIKKMFIVANFIAITSLGYAQKIGYEVGAKAGATLSVETISLQKIQNPFLFHGGAFFNLALPLIGFQVEALYSSKISIQDTSNVANPLYNNIKLNYIKVPILLEYTTAFGFVTIQTGPQFDIFLDKNIKVNNNSKDLFSQFDFNWVGGIKINIPIIKLHIYGRYIKGFTNNNVQTNTKIDQVQVGVEYGLFGKKIGI